MQLLQSTAQSDHLDTGAGWGNFLHLLPNTEQSDSLGGGAGCGHILLPRQELHACEM